VNGDEEMKARRAPSRRRPTFCAMQGHLAKGLQRLSETRPAEVPDFAVERSNRAEGLTCNSKY
jgi:hypothetical protein